MHGTKVTWGGATLLILLLLAGGCSEDRLTGPESGGTGPGLDLTGPDPEALAADMIRAAGWDLDPTVPLPDKIQLLDMGRPFRFPVFNRVEIAENIAHYTFEIPVGPGPHDFIRIHRVVKERQAGKPSRTRTNLFMLPGDGAGFEAAFLLSTLSAAVPADHAMPIYLARNDVDVWGLDLGWTQVPAGTTDLSFMADWGLQKDIDDLRLAGGIARFVRMFTGHAGRARGDDEVDDDDKSDDGRTDKINLLGWSRGGMIGYACLNHESQLHPSRRHFDGFIPTDIWFKTDTLREEECDYAAGLEEMINAGTFADDTGAFLAWMVELARTVPNEVSPVFGEPFNNLQAIVAFGSMTYLVSPIPEHYSILSGTFDADGMPVGFQYAPTEYWLDFLSNWAPYEPVRMMLETEWAVCGDPAHPVPFDDHLGDITVPVMYLGAHGGVGEIGLYTLGLLGSSDITSLVVSVQGDPFLDFAHADLFLASNAPELVWAPVLDWVRQH